MIKSGIFAGTTGGEESRLRIKNKKQGGLDSRGRREEQWMQSTVQLAMLLRRVLDAKISPVLVLHHLGQVLVPSNFFVFFFVKAVDKYSFARAIMHWFSTLKNNIPCNKFLKFSHRNILPFSINDDQIDWRTTRPCIAPCLEMHKNNHPKFH